jgi:hypothetical protein
MTPEKLIEVLKRYQRESNQEKRMLAARIGVIITPFIQWLTSSESPIKGRLALAACFLRRVGYV